MSKAFFTRAGQAGPNDIAQRIPELAPLRGATISVFGLGALGAPSVMEFARSGVRKIYAIDYDVVDPATVCRWPFGLQSAGVDKAAVLWQAIQRDYPFTEIVGCKYYVGGVRDPEKPGESAQAIMKQVTDGATLIYDATAEIGVQQFLSDCAAELGVPYIGVDATPGGWGGRVLSLVPDRTKGCWLCYRHSLWDKTIAEPPMHPNGEIQPVGCSDPTFTGAGFDLLFVALMGVKIAVSTLCKGTTGAYPAAGWDVTTIALRGEDGSLIPPRFESHLLKVHPKCLRCNPS